MKHPLDAKNKEQTKLVRSIHENPVTIVTGVPGSGKTFCAVGFAIQELMRERCKRIILSRPLVCTGKSLPALPGDLHEKMDPYWIQMQEYINYFLTKEKADYLRKTGQIVFQPLELMRGMNFDKEYVVVTEAQNATYAQLKMLLTRIGDFESRIIIDGDVKQTDLRATDEDWECPLIRITNRLESVDEVGHVDLIQSLRHPLVDKIDRLL
jgi:phosphate starvation-inducible PhoH-like protein